MSIKITGPKVMDRGSHQRLCSRRGCDAQALWVPIVKMWAKGDPKSSEPLQMEIGMQLCERHKNEFTMDEFPSLGNLARQACRGLGKEPDPASAELVMQPVVKT